MIAYPIGYPMPYPISGANRGGTNPPTRPDPYPIAMDPWSLTVAEVSSSASVGDAHEATGNRT